MAWKDDLRELREELADVRAQRQVRYATEEADLAKVREELTALANSLEVAALLTEINTTLLDGKGQVATLLSWESDGDEGEEEDDDPELYGPDSLAVEDEDEDAVSTVLSWDEDGDREIAVEVVMAEDGISLQVNGVEVRRTRDALEAGLIAAFRDELEL